MPKKVRNQVICHYTTYAKLHGRNKDIPYLTQKFYCPFIICGTYIHAHACHSCVKSKYYDKKNHHKTKLVLSNRPLNYIEIDYLDPLRRRETISNTSSSSTIGKTKSHAPLTCQNNIYVMLNHWILEYKIRNTILSDNGLQFVSTFWNIVHHIIGM